jgi:hypothetical protein
LANAQLQDLLDAANRKNHELVESAKEVDANALWVTAEHLKVAEELHQAWASE